VRPSVPHPCPHHCPGGGSGPVGWLIAAVIVIVVASSGAAERIASDLLVILGCTVGGAVVIGSAAVVLVLRRRARPPSCAAPQPPQLAQARPRAIARPVIRERVLELRVLPDVPGAGNAEQAKPSRTVPAGDDRP
jgi:hypothetical protein